MRDVFTTALELAGVLAIICAAFLVAGLPAALITFGAGCLVTSWRVSR